MLERSNKFSHLFLNSITLIPEKNKTYTPDAPINKEVPKSGCLAIRRTTIPIASIEITTERGLGGKVFSLKIAAIVIGTIIFINSEGWNLTNPRSSHLWAPPPELPKNSTDINRKIPRIISIGLI